MPQEGRYAGAKTFLAKLGLDGAAVDAMLVGVVEASTDDGLPVPKQVKKAWLSWNLTGHPDKGGDQEAYTAMKGEYTAFKQSFQAWQQEHPRGQPDFQTWSAASMPASSGGPPSASRQKAALKDKAKLALAAAKEALEMGRYEDAAAKGAEAESLFEQCQKMSKVTDKDVRESITQARALIERVEEGKRRVQEEAQKEEAMAAFEDLCRYVCAGTPDSGLDWAQKADAVRSRFEGAKQEIECLKTILSEVESKANDAELAAQKQIAELEKQVEKVSCERDEVIAEKRERDQDLDECRRAFEKEESSGFSVWEFFGWSKKAKNKLSPSQMIEWLKESLRAVTQNLSEVQAEKEECNKKLQQVIKDKVDRLEKLTGELQSSQEKVAQTTAKIASLQADLDRSHLQAAEMKASADAEMQRKLDEEKAARETQVCAVRTAVITAVLGKKVMVVNACLADRTWRRWVFYVEDRKRLQAQSKRVVSRLGRRTLSKAWECWYEYHIQTALEAKSNLDKEMQRKSSQPAKFKVQHLGASDSGWRVIECHHESPDMFQALVRRVREHFGLPDEGPFFQYVDKEGDTISVNTSEELEEAMHHFAPSYPKLTLPRKASDKVVAQAGVQMEKADKDLNAAAAAPGNNTSTGNASNAQTQPAHDGSDPASDSPQEIERARERRSERERKAAASVLGQDVWS